MNKAKKTQINEFLNLRFYKSLSNYPDYYYDFKLNLYLAYENHNILPFSGCYSDQPNKIIETFNVIKALINEKQDKDNKKKK